MTATIYEKVYADFRVHWYC